MSVFVFCLFFYATCSSVVQACVHDMPSCKNIDMDDIDIYIYSQKWCSAEDTHTTEIVGIWSSDGIDGMFRCFTAKALKSLFN